MSVDDTLLYGGENEAIVWDDEDCHPVGVSPWSERQPSRANSFLEQKYTSTTAKLLKQTDRFGEWSKGVFRPVSLQLAPTDKCNLKCSFCSVANRNGDDLSYLEAKTALKELAELGLKTVEFTGGGDPTLYPYLTDLIEWAYAFKLGIGLITNGIALTAKVSQWHLDMLDWVRISMNCLDYVDDIAMPVFTYIEKSSVLGLSYVMNSKTTQKTIDKLLRKAGQADVPYIRVVPNCLSTDTIKESAKQAKELGLLDNSRVFWQEKKHVVPHHCRIGYLKPFLNADGYFYHCSANPLIERKFHPKFRMGRIDEIKKIWGEDYPAFDTGNCQEGKCFFKEHNDLLDLFGLTIQHRNFI